MRKLADDKTPRCLDCDYPLVGLSESRCPECGREYNFGESATFLDGGGPLGLVARYFLKPPGTLFNSVCGLTAIPLLVSVSLPGVTYEFLLVSVSLWLVLGMIWCGRAFGWVRILNSRKGAQGIVRGTTLRNWFVGPLIFAIAIFLCSAGVPMWTTFLVSKSAMDRLAHQIMNGTNSIKGPISVGIMSAKDCELIPGGMRFRVGTWRAFSDAGWMYLNSKPAVSSDSELEIDHWYGNWYTWRRKY